MRKILVFFLLAAFSSAIAQRPITLEDCFTYFKFYPESGGGFDLAPDGQHYFEKDDGRILEFVLATGEQSRVVLEKSELGDVSEWDEFTFSSDLSKVLLRTNTKPVYRHSVLADYWVFDLKTRKASLLYESGAVQFTAFSPDGDAVAFVSGNNLFYKDLVKGQITQITTDGAQNRIINGLPDWVYEEEFSPVTGESMVATRWSPDGSKIAFIRFDESKVKEFPLSWYTNDQYPGRTTFKYPKVGEANSIVSVHLYDLEEGRMQGQIMGLEANDYVPRINWANENQLIVSRLNRRQDTLELLRAMPERVMYDAEEGVNWIPARLLMQETNDAYVDIHDNLIFLKNSPQYIWTSEKSGFNHVWLYPLIPATPPLQLTSGNFDVTAFYGVNEKTGKFYYQAATPTPLERQIWEGDLKGTAPRLLTHERGTSDATFSPTFDTYTLSWSEANTPPVVTIRKLDGAIARTLTDNERVRKLRTEYGFVEKGFWKFQLADGTELNGWMLRPKNLEPGRKYPVLFDNYGGPGSQTVLDQYDGYLGSWHQMLVQKGIIVVSVDNRGTGARGQAFKKCTQLQLGKLETEDQIAAARYLGTLPYVDAGRIGIWGWSFGGYLSSSCILKGNTVFKMAMAVAPVTNWKWCDSAYTERYMHTTKDNAAGYEENSPVNFAGSLRGDNFLVCHGIADDNVHWQQTVEMIDALVKANKQFETYYYPNRNHGIYGDNATMHLFTKLTRFLEEKL